MYIAFVCIFLSIFLFTYNKNHLSKKNVTLQQSKLIHNLQLIVDMEHSMFADQLLMHTSNIDSQNFTIHNYYIYTSLSCPEFVALIKLGRLTGLTNYQNYRNY